MTARRWCFTINNPSEEELPEEWTTNQLKMMLCQLERGEEGTLHLQGYLEMKSPCRLAALKRLLPRAHLEVSRGSRFQAMNYCLKETTEDQRWWLYEGELVSFDSEWPTSLTTVMESNSVQTNGGRYSNKSRLLAIRSKLSEGNSATIEEIADNEFDIWVRYYRAFEKYLLMKTPQRNHSVDVHVVQGPTGTGKSRWAMETYPGAYWKQRSQWWDGYMGHETVIFDEFYGWVPFDLLLRVCDRYPLLVETKGGQVQFVAKTVIITSNSLPNNWYRSAYFPSFIRRVTKWHVFPIWGEHGEYETYEEFLSNACHNVLSP